MTDSSDDPGIAAEFLSAMEFDFSTWESRLEKLNIHTVYCATEKDAVSVMDELEKHASDWNDCGAGIGNFELVTIDKEDWAEVWKKHFKLRHVSEKLIIKPSWIDYTPSAGEAVVVLDPGMSFGTGQHPTTFFCLRMIDILSAKTADASFLDAGCGSGILAIAAKKLGFNKISAFDIDPDATEIAKENFEINNIDMNQIRLETASLEEFAPAQEGYDVIAANILSGILIRNRDTLLAMLKPSGHIILAGILATEYDNVKNAFTEAGLREIENFQEQEWKSGLFHKSL